MQGPRWASGPGPARTGSWLSALSLLSLYTPSHSHLCRGLPFPASTNMSERSTSTALLLLALLASVGGAAGFECKLSQEASSVQRFGNSPEECTRHLWRRPAAAPRRTTAGLPAGLLCVRACLPSCPEGTQGIQFPSEAPFPACVLPAATSWPAPSWQDHCVSRTAAAPACRRCAAGP